MAAKPKKHHILICSTSLDDEIYTAPVHRQLQKASVVSSEVWAGSKTEWAASSRSEPQHLIDTDKAPSLFPGVSADSAAAFQKLLRFKKPSAVLLRGGSNTSAVCALSAFHNRVPVMEIEAGLRTFDAEYFYPRESNRRIVSSVSSVHFAPDNIAVDSLRKEGYKNIHLSGSTGDDTCTSYKFSPGSSDKILICFTSQSKNAERFLDDISVLARRYPKMEFVLADRNQKRKWPKELFRSGLSDASTLKHKTFIQLLSGVKMVITDHEDVQREAELYGKKTLFCGRISPRMEAVQNGAVKLVPRDLVNVFEKQLHDSDPAPQLGLYASPSQEIAALIKDMRF